MPYVFVSFDSIKSSCLYNATPKKKIVKNAINVEMEKEVWQPHKKVGLFFLLSDIFGYIAISVSAEEVTAPIPIPKFGIGFGSRYRYQNSVSVSESEP